MVDCERGAQVQLDWASGTVLVLCVLSPLLFALAVHVYYTLLWRRVQRDRAEP